MGEERKSDTPWDAATAGTRGADDPPCCPDAKAPRAPLARRRFRVGGDVRPRLPATRMFLVQGRRA